MNLTLKGLTGGGFYRRDLGPCGLPQRVKKGYLGPVRGKMAEITLP